MTDGADYLMIGTGVLLVVGLILSLQGGLVPKVVTLAILLGSVATTFFSGQMKDNIEPLKVIGVAILAILFFVAPMAVGLFVGDGTSVGIGEIELREDSNTIAFKARGSFGTAYASIVVDNGTGSEDVLWEEEEKRMTSDSASFVVAIDDIFVGNAWDNNGQEQRVYNIVVNDGKDSESKVPINARYLTRQVTDTGFKLTPIFENSGEEGLNLPLKDSACKFYSEFFLIHMSISTEHLTLILKDLFQYLVIIQLTLKLVKVQNHGIILR